MSKYLKESKWKTNVILYIAFCMGIIAKQFYLLPNGSLQIGDILMLVPAIAFFMNGMIQLEPIDRKIGLFVLFASMVNVAYYLFYRDSSFLKYTSYLIFSFIIIWSTRKMISELGFISVLRKSCYLAIFIQTLIALFGLGRSLWGSRYIGTFNDPNQLAFYVFSVSLCGYVCGVILGEKTYVFLQIPAIYLIFRSSSMSMTMGFLIFLAFAYLHPGWSQVKHGYLYLAIVLFLIIIVLILRETDLIKDIPFLSSITDSVLWHRTMGKIERSDSSFLAAFIRDRSMTRIIEKPIYLLFGSGEGYWRRYEQGNEIHCTMIALLYYYGIIPYSFFLAWIADNLRGIKNELLPAYIAIILEAFTLANHRQPTFWLMFVLASVPLAKKNSEENVPSLGRYRYIREQKNMNWNLLR